MLKIFIYMEDNTQRKALYDSISKKIVIEEYNMELTLSSSSSQSFYDIVSSYFLSEERFYTGLYFLDISTYEGGIGLAQRLRDIDPLGFIIILSDNTEILPRIIHSMIAPLDFIVKESFAQTEKCIHKCMEEAAVRYNKLMSNTKTGKTLRLTSGKKIYSLYLDEILYITTTDSAHKIQISCLSKTLIIRSSISVIERQLTETYYKIARETIVNISHIQEFDSSLGIITMTDGTIFQISRKKIQDFKQKIVANI